MAAEKFDWGQIINLPTPPTHKTFGHQVLHFYPLNKPFWEPSQTFVDRHLSKAIQYVSDAEVLKFGSDAAASQEGMFLEFGVCSGKTINFIAALNPRKKIFGFDSFEGLPEDWRAECKKGAFSFKQPNFLPPVLNNVELIKGWFSDTLPAFLETHEGPVAFVHIDCDLYSSTSCVFQNLKDRIQPGTIIVFDELYNYPGFENHELKALQEFLDSTGYQAEYLAYNIHHEQIAIRIRSP
ncbi:MAG TPA: class I SAM-dependent methyltransferase [Chlamydiales bacterium]|nr:class I SAM-dependent methyltransferase [Chlamydiales bacterium]